MHAPGRLPTPAAASSGGPLSSEDARIMVNTRWARLREAIHLPGSRPSFAFDLGLALASGILCLWIFRWRAEWSNIDIRNPSLYLFDPLYYANAVWNAQLGDVFTGRSLGSPGAQQIGLSSYGVEWVQAWFTGQLDRNPMSPWRAIYRYWELSYAICGLTSFIALRWLRCSRLPAFMGALAFTFIPQHEFNIRALYFVNIGTLPLALALLAKLVGGATWSELLPRAWGIPDQRSRAAALALAFSVFLFGLLGANYHMVFVFFLASILGAVMLMRRRWWPRALRIGAVAALSTVSLAISYLPIILGRARAGLPFAEETQADRRAFAAYINGGDPFGFFLPFDSGFIERSLSHISVYSKFFTEYDSSPLIAGTEFTVFRGGFAVSSAVLLLLLQALGLFRRADRFRSVSRPFGAWWSAATMLLITALLTMRGGLGTLISFVAPQIRGYARASTLMTFMAIVLICLAATATTFRSRVPKLIALVLLVACCVESISATVPHVQEKNVNTLTRIVPSDPAVSGSASFELRMLGPLGTHRLIDAAQQKFAPGCQILTFPLAKYPVDFGIGLKSYYAYELIKPGLVESNLTWSSGGFPGTPGNKFSDTWLEAYRSGDVASVVKAADAVGMCGVILFRSLQDGFHRAGPASGSRYTQQASDVDLALQNRYGGACYTDADAQIEIYCRK